MRKFVIAAALAVAALGGGCYRNTGSADTPRTIVHVDNQSFSDFNIYVVPEAGNQIRLGLCPAKTQHDFVIPASVITGFARSMRFLARPLATQAGPVSEDVVVSPGDVIGLQIPPG
jgi:hypothetical protein